MHTRFVAFCLTFAAWACAEGARAREVSAFPLRVLAASELRVEPRLAPDRSSLELRVRLQDDRGQPLRGREVALRVRVDDEPERPAVLPLGDDGEATHSVPLARGQRVVRAAASYAGDGVTAAQEREITVDLDAPYVTVDLVAPPGGVELGGAPAEFVVSLRVGEVIGDYAPSHRDVEVRLGDRPLAAGSTDASGRAVLRVPASAFAAPGVFRVHARAMVRGSARVSASHDLLVRARTALSLVRAGDGDPDPASPAVLRGALVTVTGAPVPGASVRVLRGAHTLAGARTDARGGYQVRLGPEVLAEPGVTVRAAYEPPEPWYGASESPAVMVTAPPPPRIHWSWVVGPAALAAAALAAAVLRARLRGGEAAAPAPADPGAWDRVEHVAPAPPSAGLRVRFVVVDRATARPVGDPMVRWGAAAEWRPAGGESHAVEPARRVEFEVGASGYAPRKVTGEFSRPGEYVVRVQLRTWREELFERARPWLRRVGAEGALPTLREALATRAATPGALAFVEHVEEGCYAPRAPTAADVARAEELSAVVDPAAPPARD